MPSDLPLMSDYAHLFAPLAAYDSAVYFCYCPAQGRVLYVSEAYERELGGAGSSRE